MRRRIRIGALGIVDEQHVAAAADLFHAMRQTGKTAQAVLQDFGRDTERQRAGGSAGGILRVVRPAQRTDAADPRDLAARAPRGAPDGFALDIDAVRQRVFHRYPDHVPARLLDPVGGVAAPSVIDADDRGALRLHAGDQTLLHSGIVFERAVAIDVVFADIEQDADARIERRRKIDLVRRHLDNVYPPDARRLQRQDRGADVAAHLRVVTGDAHQMRDQRRRG